MATNPTTDNDATQSPPSDCRARLLASVRAAWQRWRDRLRKIRGLFLLGLAASVLAPACGDSAAPPPARGSISVSWTLTGLDRKPTTCDAVGAATVRLRLRNRAGGAEAATFPCAGSPGTSQVVAAAYDVTPELLAADGTVLATGPDQAAVTIAAGQTATLTPVAFAVDTASRFTISLVAPPFGTNCKAATQGGAGITGDTLTLFSSIGTCVPVRFVRARGTTPTGTYQVSCSSPPVTSCIERDETLTAEVDPGPYVLHVRGKVGAGECWRADETIEVPFPGRPVLPHPVNLGRLGAPGC